MVIICTTNENGSHQRTECEHAVEAYCRAYEFGSAAGSKDRFVSIYNDSVLGPLIIHFVNGTIADITREVHDVHSR